MLDSVLECYRDYITNNKSIQDALKRDDDTPQNQAYRELGKAYVDYVSSLFEDMSKCVAIESILAVTFYFLKKVMLNTNLEI